MTDTTPTEIALADLSTGVARTLAAICRQLIESRALDKDLLLGTFVEVGIALGKEKAGPIGMLFPAMVSAALQQSAEKQP